MEVVRGTDWTSAMGEVMEGVSPPTLICFVALLPTLACQ